MKALSEAIKIVGGRKACDHCFNCLYHTGRRHFFDGFLCARCGYWEMMVLGVLEAGFDPEVAEQQNTTLPPLIKFYIDSLQVINNISKNAVTLRNPD